MEKEQIQKYWDQRASSDNSAQSTTQDYYLREIEVRVIRELIQRLRPASVLDVGCGDARTTANLAMEFDGIKFVGCDYSQSMVNNANENIRASKLANLDARVGDVVQKISDDQFDMIYTTRCLINLPTWDMQQTALKNIVNAIADDGHYVMIENFVEGQTAFNRIRKEFGLPEIPIRDHNNFFERGKLTAFVAPYFDLVEEVNISSAYYLASRVLYSKICQDKGTAPDYFDAHHEYAAKLPFSGEWGPVRMICFKRK